MEQGADNGTIRDFATGATRSSAQGKPDYEGYLSPLVIEAFGRYMLRHQVQADGNVRASDNWQKGIPQESYIKSLWRHILDLWKMHRGYISIVTDSDGRTWNKQEVACAVMFNVMGYLHEELVNMEVTGR